MVSKASWNLLARKPYILFLLMLTRNRYWKL
jgi:hypothetical protein